MDWIFQLRDSDSFQRLAINPNLPPHRLATVLKIYTNMKSSIPSAGGTFQPLRHRSGTMRDRLHAYTKQTLGAGGSVTEAVSFLPV